MVELIVEQKAIQDWKKYPALAEVFEGPDQYCDYLANDFESALSRCMKETGCSRVEAIRETAREHPILHRQWIAVVNIIGNGG